MLTSSAQLAPHKEREHKHASLAFLLPLQVPPRADPPGSERAVSCDGVWGDLRFPEGEPSIGDWTWRIVGDFRGLMPGECTWLPATDISTGFRPRPR